ncbi:MAG: SGNH/GDSL hydrolase family protein [Butyricicoccaceae bacterium]
MDDRNVICLGDSIVEGYGIDPEECWVSCLSSPAVNCGVSGDTTRDVLRRFSFDVAEKQPQTVVLLIGINDLLNGSRVPSVVSRTEQIIQAIRSVSAQTVLCTYPEPDYDELLGGAFAPASIYNFPERLREYHRWIRNTCKQNDFLCIDFAYEMERRAGNDRCRLFLDGVHPNRFGHMIMAEIAEEVFSKF